MGFGHNQEFLQGEKIGQEIAEGCRRLIKNAIVCWHSLYLTQQILAEPDAARRQAMLSAVQHGSVSSWRHVNLHGAPRSARKESFYEETLLGVNSVARGTCHRTRGRRWWEAPSTMWRRGRLRPRALLARVWLGLRKKLPCEASYHGPPVYGRPRVELPECGSRRNPCNFV